MEKILEVKNLKKYFPINRNIWGKPQGYVRAVDDVSFSLNKGETLGIVGESGSGKSTTGRSILRLVEPTSGEILYKDKEIRNLSGESLRSMRRHMQMIFQDPYASLNPRMTIGEAIEEPMRHNELYKSKDCKDKVFELLEKVGLNQRYYNRYPYEFSGGQRQRVGIARALGVKPEIIIADEPVSALDVSVQAQILNLFMDLQQEYNLTYVFIAHDLSVVKHISNKIAVMYLGEIVELADREDIFASPMHPYTQALISAIPIADPKSKRNRIILKGDIPSPSSPPPGCKFSTRCISCMDICKKEKVELKSYNNRMIRCHLYR